ncbi:TetR/AcrR family transcriptional regulator [Mycolicibacterium boenickei]|nr:TetR/AcrR family transcriptional regulator [Mycolicibacterium boenickei]
MSNRTGRTPRTRRTGDEIRARLLAAGRSVFAELGYAGASTNEIAQRAEVAEVLIFRHFGSKAGLFDVAVLDPFESFVDEWQAWWSRHALSGESVEELAHDYIDRLYGFFADNRDLVEALLAARAHRPEVSERLNAMFARLEKTVREGAAEYGLPVRDPGTTVRLTFGLVLSAVVHSEMLFPAGASMSRAELTDELARYMLHGITHLP